MTQQFSEFDNILYIASLDHHSSLAFIYDDMDVTYVNHSKNFNHEVTSQINDDHYYDLVIIDIPEKGIIYDFMSEVVQSGIPFILTLDSVQKLRNNEVVHFIEENYDDIEIVAIKTGISSYPLWTITSAFSEEKFNYIYI